MAIYNNEEGSVVLDVVTLIIAIAALILAWVAYDRTGGDLDQRIQEGIEQSAQTIEGAAEGAQEVTNDGAEDVEQGAENVEQETENTNRESTNDTQTTQ